MLAAKRTFLRTGVAAFGGALLASRFANAQAARITTTDLGGAWLFQGAGGNVVALPGPDGALMIDGGRAANADALLDAVKKATGTTRIHTLINTHWHPDQVGANEAVGKAGGVIIAHEKTKTDAEQHGLQRDRHHRACDGAARSRASEQDRAPRRRRSSFPASRRELRLHARRAHRRRHLHSRSEVEPAGRWWRGVSRGVAAARLSERCVAWWPRPRRRSISPISSSPTPASLPRRDAR